jgi:hypothetical protein
MSVVIYQRQQAGRMGVEGHLPYRDVDAVPLPPKPEREETSVGRRLSSPLRSLLRTRGTAAGALR